LFLLRPFWLGNISFDDPGAGVSQTFQVLGPEQSSPCIFGLQGWWQVVGNSRSILGFPLPGNISIMLRIEEPCS